MVRTQVGIVGGGPAGLLLSHLLHLHGIESVVVEIRSRAYTEQRIRAGVLEHGTVDLLVDVGLGDRLKREGLVHEGIELRFEGRGHRIDLAELTGGKTITVYGQQEVQKDLNTARGAAGGQVLYEVADVRVEGVDSDAPVIRFRQGDEQVALDCDLIAGCDGFHGICRPSVPATALTTYDREYPFGWLGILARVSPASEELIYSAHERGFALLSMRSPELSRLYVQCEPDAQVDDWSDERVWEELHARLSGEGLVLEEGPVVEKVVTAMRSFVAEPLRHGRLFLAGDAAHIVPPAGAKGLNLAVADVRVLSEAVEAWYRGRTDLLDAYSQTCLRRVWRVQHFSWWMTSMLHRFAGDDPFERRLQLAQLAYVTSSRAAATTLAENYVGLAMGAAA